MGYTHYWYRKIDIDQDMFTKIATDFFKAKPYLEDFINGYLSGGDGTGFPEINNQIIIFNGNQDCGHPQRNLGITWPSKDAKGISNGSNDVAQVGWFAGAHLTSRTCGGDCSHETFYFPRVEGPREYQKENWPEFEEDFCFECTKTAYKPYDLAVTVALVIAKHYLGDQIYVHSDGEMKDWEDAVKVCEALFHYGSEFQLDEGKYPIRKEPLPKPVAEFNTKTGEGYVVLGWVGSKTGDDDYTIKAHSDGIISCNCKGWKYSKAKPKTCSHIKEMKIFVETGGKFGTRVRLAQTPACWK